MPAPYAPYSRDGLARVLDPVVVRLEVRDNFRGRLFHGLRSLLRRRRAGELVRRVLVPLNTMGKATEAAKAEGDRRGEKGRDRVYIYIYIFSSACIHRYYPTIAREGGCVCTNLAEENATKTRECDALVLFFTGMDPPCVLRS